VRLKPDSPKGTREGREGSIAVMLADGGEEIGDVAVRRHQRRLFGPVASTGNAWHSVAALQGRMPMMGWLGLARMVALYPGSGGLVAEGRFPEWAPWL
jgi:hypothetical protein